MLSNKPYMRVLKYIFVASVLLLLMANDCDYTLNTPSDYGIGNAAEEGSLKGASLVWTSDIDGEVGTGEAFTGSLSEGTHIIILTVTDSQQGGGSSAVTITVAAP